MSFLTQSPVRVRILEQRDWIDSSHPTYTITSLDELVIEEVAPLTESIGIARNLRPFLKWVPRDSFSFDPRTLADATVLPFDLTDPYNWVNITSIDSSRSLTRV